MSKSIKYYIAYGLKVGTLLSTTGLVISVIVQIYSRFLMENAPSWTEEASRFFFIYAISFASGLAYQQNYFVFLDLITNKLNVKNNLLLEKVVNYAVFLLFLIMATFSVSYISLGLAEKSPSLEINMAVSFTSILLMALSICFFAGLRIIQLNRKKI